jgi:hypothetical protein
MVSVSSPLNTSPSQILTEFSRHLSGVKSLLDEAKVPRMAYATAHTLPSRAQVASFWNFARCDYLAAFINRTPTRLDTGDLSLWRSAGLLIDDEGLVEPSKWDYSSYYHREDEMREDMVSNALVWLLSKIMNYLAVDWDGNCHTDYSIACDSQSLSSSPRAHKLYVPRTNPNLESPPPRSRRMVRRPLREFSTLRSPPRSPCQPSVLKLSQRRLPGTLLYHPYVCRNNATLQPRPYPPPLT